jgi:hypothetical protein
MTDAPSALNLWPVARSGSNLENNSGSPKVKFWHGQFATVLTVENHPAKKIRLSKFKQIFLITKQIEANFLSVFSHEAN